MPPHVNLFLPIRIEKDTWHKHIRSILFRVCLGYLVCVNAHSAGISGRVCNDYYLRKWLSSSGNYISVQLQLYPKEVDHIFHTPPSWYTLWSKNTNLHTNKQLVIAIVAFLKPCVASVLRKSTTIAWGWLSIHTKQSIFLWDKLNNLKSNLKASSYYHKPIAFERLVCISLVSAFICASATFWSICI